jgi:DNA polymerase
VLLREEVDGCPSREPRAVSVNVHCDFETRSAANLKKCGAHAYAADLTTDILCMGYANEGGPVQIWHPGLYPDLPHFFDEIDDVTLIAHNAPFEHSIWNFVGVRRYGFPEIKIENMVCTMAMAYAMALPGSLDNAAAAMGLAHQKDMQGRRIMLQLSQPREILNGEPTWWTDSVKFERLYNYCKQDVQVERELYKRLLQLSPREREVWLMDQRINERGVAVDLPLVHTALQLVETEKVRLDQRMKQVTQNSVVSCRATGQLTDWLSWRGVDVKGVAKSDIIYLLEQKIPEDCREALELRQQAAKTSTAKFEAMVQSSGIDRRIRGLFQYHGSSTGRWAGRRIQPQNFPRPKLSQKEIDGVFELLEGVDC